MAMESKSPEAEEEEEGNGLSTCKNNEERGRAVLLCYHHHEQSTVPMRRPYRMTAEMEGERGETPKFNAFVATGRNPSLAWQIQGA